MQESKSFHLPKEEPLDWFGLIRYQSTHISRTASKVDLHNPFVSKEYHRLRYYSVSAEMLLIMAGGMNKASEVCPEASHLTVMPFRGSF
jgi:hypothetical protein